MTWTCTRCNETHEDPFDSCWKCGTGRDGVSVASFPDSPETASGEEQVPKIPCATTQQLPGREILSAQGIVCGEAIMGTDILSDMVAGLQDFVGGRSGIYENKLRAGRAIALSEMADEARLLGADAVVGVHLDVETMGEAMILVAATGTAVKLKPEKSNQPEI